MFVGIKGTISQIGLRYWLGVVKQQAITSINADQDLSCYMASLGYSELKKKICHCLKGL